MAIRPPGITLLYALPVGVVAVVAGVPGGIVAAAVAWALVVVWVLVQDVGLGTVGFLTRGATFFLLGCLVGLVSRQREEAEARSGRWFEMSNDLLCEATLDGYFTRVNEAWETTLGYTAEDLTSRPYAELVHPDDVEPTVAVAGSLAAGPTDIVNFENRYRAKDGSWHWLLWSARSDGERVYAVAKDITERKRLESEREELLARVEAIARTDELTGLPNRRSWEEELRRELARSRRRGERFAVVLLDLDRFKAFNDAHGHQAGDELLREAATAWRLALRVTDFIARYGGEEFALLLPGCPPGDPCVVVDRLRAATPMGQTCSAGISLWDGEESAEAVVARADAALYAAKRGGRDRLVLADASSSRGA